jgi:hypothetical protein
MYRCQDYIRESTQHAPNQTTEPQHETRKRALISLNIAFQHPTRNHLEPSSATRSAPNWQRDVHRQCIHFLKRVVLLQILRPEIAHLRQGQRPPASALTRPTSSSRWSNRTARKPSRQAWGIRAVSSIQAGNLGETHPHVLWRIAGGLAGVLGDQGAELVEACRHIIVNRTDSCLHRQSTDHRGYPCAT